MKLTHIIDEILENKRELEWLAQRDGIIEAVKEYNKEVVGGDTYPCNDTHHGTSPIPHDHDRRNLSIDVIIKRQEELL
jgi:hypothetical protein